MNKQIEDIARVLNECCNIYDEQGRHVRNRCYECEYWSSENFCCCSYNTKEAEALYNAGYRRQGDVAREIFAEIEEVINELGYFDEIDFNSLKKKYGAEEDESES